LDASSATFPPAFATGPFWVVRRALVAVDRAVDRVDRALLDEPFLLVDLLVLGFAELRLDELRLEDRVVCAIDIAFLGLVPAARIAAGFVVPVPDVIRI
jgi:hypothetical protein